MWGGSEDDHHRPRIFIYTLPSRYTTCRRQNYGGANYGAEQRIPDALAESRWVTSNPEEADFFYVPALFYALHSDQMSEDLPELGMAHWGAKSSMACAWRGGCMERGGGDFDILHSALEVCGANLTTLKEGLHATNISWVDLASL